MGELAIPKAAHGGAARPPHPDPSAFDSQADLRPCILFDWPPGSHFATALGGFSFTRRAGKVARSGWRHLSAAPRLAL
eukprot:6795795-Pyramimonas_sp.AAC.1